MKSELGAPPDREKVKLMRIWTWNWEEYLMKFDARAKHSPVKFLPWHGGMITTTYYLVGRYVCTISCLYLSPVYVIPEKNR